MCVWEGGGGEEWLVKDHTQVATIRDKVYTMYAANQVQTLAGPTLQIIPYTFMLMCITSLLIDYIKTS